MLDLETAARADATTASTDGARYYEYTSSANPLGAKLISRVPYRSFLASLYDSGPTRVVPLDLSAELGCPGPATGPALCANFVRVLAGERVELEPNATSLVFYVLEGTGSARRQGRELPFGTGDFFALPGGARVTIASEKTARLYYVNDAPLLAYLGARASQARFEPTVYPAARADGELRKVAEAANAAQRNRVSILLGNERFPQTRTVTHTLWAMYGILPARGIQKPHRHQSIALDFLSHCPRGCYTLVGTELDERGEIVNPERVDWQPGMAFVTPPGYWHAHYNESDDPGYVIPIQDAGLHTYLRSLDIRFAR